MDKKQYNEFCDHMRHDMTLTLLRQKHDIMEKTHDFKCYIKFVEGCMAGMESTLDALGEEIEETPEA